MLKKQYKPDKTKYGIAAGGCLLIAFFLMALVASADDEWADAISSGYSAVIYDNANGLPTAVANDIVQTQDGFIWFGSYGGLIRYDGASFERIDSRNGVNSVGCLFEDSKHRLWIGTNENGIALMEKGNFQLWDEEDGLASSKVRDIEEGEAGYIYAGTVSGVSMITPDQQIVPLDDPRIAGVYIEQMKRGNDGTVYCITSEGDYFAIQGEELVYYIGNEEAPIQGITSIAPDQNDSGMIYIGTVGSEIYHCKAQDNLSVSDSVDISPLTSVSSIRQIGNNIWICAHNGIGMIDEEGFHHLSDLAFKYLVTDVMEDYQGNLWFSSSRQGAMKLSPNRFSNLFKQYDIPEQVVNSTCMYEDKLFVGTETGLIVIGQNGPVSSVPVTDAKYSSGKTYEADDLLKLTDGCRIRSIIRDSRDRIWISTWQSLGLLRFDHGKLAVFTKTEGLPSDRLRAVYEASDGSILVASTGGVSVIRADCVTITYDRNDGITTIESLTVAQAPNGDILLGSNGGGIYIIGKDGLQCIDKKDGLTSGVVMRIKYDPQRDVFWLITGNSIAYMTSDYKVTTVDRFPYSDNLDFYQNSRGEFWILSSNGIYVTSPDELIANDSIYYEHYGIANGLPGNVVSNSYSELTDEGNLYIAGNNCVIKVNIDEPAKKISDIKQTVPYIDADGERYFADQAGEFKIPSDTKKVTIYGYVLNYSLADPITTLQLEGFDPLPMVYRQSEMHPMVYTNLNGGSYRYVMTIKDELGNDSKTLSVRIVKQKALTEQVWFYVLSAVVFLAVMAVLLRWYTRKKMQKLEEKHHVEAEKERANNELRMANKIQMSMLPHEFPPFPDRDEIDIYATMDPAREVGGDFYDYFLIDDDHLCLLIADVSGKGIPAALFMMNVKVILQIIAKDGSAAEEILSRVNNAICSNNQLEMFVTVWVGILELSTGKLTAANAGHEYPLIKRSGGAFELLRDKHGFVLGGMEDIDYKRYELQLDPGDMIFVYTDGLTEATNEANEMFGTARMLDAVNTDPQASPEQLLNNVHEAVNEFVKTAEQFDDLTMLCLEFKGKQGGRD